jgi:hypothetical protein
MSHRGTKANRTTVNIRLVDDPTETARFKIQEQGDNEEWITLRMFSSENEARTLFAHIKEHGLGARVLETAKAPVT